MVMVGCHENMAVQDGREVAVAVNGPSCCNDNHKTKHRKGGKESEPAPSWRRPLPPPSHASESAAPYEGVHHHEERDNPAVVAPMRAQPGSPFGSIDEKERA